jgi:hypothetical protein
MPRVRLGEIYIIVAFVFVLLFGCQQQKDSHSDGDNLQETALPEELLASSEYQLWETLVGDFKDGLFRGVSFDDAREKVQITEVFELFEEAPDHLGYTHDTKELETLDIYYHFSEEGTVEQIVADVFLNGKSSADRLWRIAGWYFERQYGEPSERDEQKMVWSGGNTTVTVEVVSSDMDNGLKVAFVPGSGSVLANRGASLAIR